MHTDLQLLSRYHQRADALAFRELMQAHASMVFATAKRITRDAALAEDVAQETFLQLARQSKLITESVAAWLHRVAWRRACNAVRDDATRRRLENAASAEIASTSESSWSEVETELDAVIDELPDQLRGPLVMHFLEGKSQREIAKQLGVNQSTVSRAVESGLAEVRSKLRNKGLLCGAGLGAMISAESASAAPASLMLSASKLGLSGIGGTVDIATGSAWLTAPVKLGIAASALLLGVVASTQLASSKSDHTSVTSGTSTAVRSLLSAPETIPTTSAIASPSSDERKRLADFDRPPLAGAGSITNLRALASVAKVPETASARLIAANSPSTRTSATSRHRSAESTPSASIANGSPVHELVHSFPTPPQNPSGHLARDANGWIWGTMATGGEYGQGLIYKFRADGSEWQQVFSFNGPDGAAGPLDGLLLTDDGSFWGVTNGRDDREPSTLFMFDPRSNSVTTLATSTDRRLTIRPIVGPDDNLWGTSNAGVYRFDRATKQLTMVVELTGRAGAHPGDQIRGGLTADGLGYLWCTASSGGANGNGTIFKINVATLETSTVVEFTGRSGAFIGEHPFAALTPDDQGYLWGTTRGTGTIRRTDNFDGGTIFKIHASTGAFTHVTDFANPPGKTIGKHPETNLAFDGTDSMWGTTSYGGSQDSGTVFKVNTRTGQFSQLAQFTAYYGDTLGSAPRGHLMLDGAGGVMGVCHAGGVGFVGTIYHIDVATGAFSLIKDIATLATTNEGAQPQGSLVAGPDGWLWGVCSMNGAYHSGSVFKVDPITNTLVSVVDFTGSTGPHRGRDARAGLFYDGNGFFWGTTRSGGTKNFGTLYKINARTHEFTTLIDFLDNGNKVRGGSLSDLVPDGKGWLWCSTFSHWSHIQGTVYKVNMTTNELIPISTFEGDRGPRFGRGPGSMAYDGNGFIWGASMANYQNRKGSLFKIDINTNKRTTVAELLDCSPPPGFQAMGDMLFDGKSSLWFSAVIDGGSRNAGNALVKVNTQTGEIEGRYRQPGYADIASPIMDENGILWGTTVFSGSDRKGSIYTFDPATKKFATVMSFTGNGSQPNSGSQPQVGRLMKHSDGNFYGMTRFGGPGGNGTVFRLRFGPTPMTQEATLFADGRAELHGTITPNGRDSEVAFEWDTDAALAHPKLLAAGTVSAGAAAKPVAATLAELKPATTYYFRVRGTNAANRIPQRGAILSFTTPPLLVDASKPNADAQNSKNGGNANSLSASTLTTQHALKINRIPGAGAGFVRGALEGSAYEIGKRYTLTAVADNNYLFDHWSGPGITGADAENARLSFVFTEALAKSPVITCTFVKNPFRDEAIGQFNGLISNVEALAPYVSNTGAIRLSVSPSGTFTGALRYDSDVLPITGIFDTGGLARFGPKRLSSWALVRQDKPALFLSMQLDLSADGPHEVYGTIGNAGSSEVTERSTFSAARRFYDGNHLVPASYLANGGRFPLATSDGANGIMQIAATGSTTFAAKLTDGTGVLAQSPLSAASQACFFQQLYAHRTGSFGGALVVADLLQDDPSDQPFWWASPAHVWLSLNLHRAR